MQETAIDSCLTHEVQNVQPKRRSHILEAPGGSMDWEVENKGLPGLAFVNKFLNMTMNKIDKLDFIAMKIMSINRHCQNWEKQCAGREKYLQIVCLIMV